ncbi:hypothetical protein VQ056_13950 [Paenibacillus sp. JTLBN-2024]
MYRHLHFPEIREIAIRAALEQGDAEEAIRLAEAGGKLKIRSCRGSSIAGRNIGMRHTIAQDKSNSSGNSGWSSIMNGENMIITGL